MGQGRLLKLVVGIVAVLSLSAEAGEGTATGDSETAKPTEPRASRAKRRGGSEVLRG